MQRISAKKLTNKTLVREIVVACVLNGISCDKHNFQLIINGENCTKVFAVWSINHHKERLIDGDKISNLVKEHRQHLLKCDDEFHRGRIDWDKLHRCALDESIKTQIGLSDLIYRKFFIDNGFMPKLCVLNGYLLAKLIKSGSDPCFDCEVDKSVCGGRTYEMFFDKTGGLR